MKARTVVAPRQKTGEPRTIFLNAAMREILTEAKKLRTGLVRPQVFLTPEGEPIPMYRAKQALVRAFRRAKLGTEDPWKRLRHAHGTRVGAAGATELETMAALCHASADMARHYIRITDARLRAISEKIGGRFDTEGDSNDSTEVDTAEATR